MHDYHFKFYKSTRDDLDLNMKNVGFSMFHCVLLTLASQKTRRQRLIIFCAWNTILSKFLLFSIHSSCWMQDAKLGKNVQVLEGIF